MADRKDPAAAQGFACTCAGPMVNTHVDGNGGHSPGCPANPATWPESLRVCAGCGIPFSTPITPEQAFAELSVSDFSEIESAEYVCNGCEPYA